jgi:hypothetical protein
MATVNNRGLTVERGVLSPVRVKPAQTEMQNPELEPSRVKAASNTFTIVLRILGCDEKGSLESVAIKHGHES